MQDYGKSCIREKDPDYVIFYVRKNELSSELPPERIENQLWMLLKILSQTIE